MNRLALSALLMLPSVCLASGDIGVVWWIGGTSLVYFVVAIALVMLVVRRQTGATRLILFVALGSMAWFWFLNSSADQTGLQAILLVALASVFLIGIRRK